jgi:hypothetical protein
MSGGAFQETGNELNRYISPAIQKIKPISEEMAMSSETLTHHNGAHNQTNRYDRVMPTQKWRPNSEEHQHESILLIPVMSPTGMDKTYFV